VLGWWRHIEPETARHGSGSAIAGARIVAARRLATLGLIVIGLLVGFTAAGVALSYDGRYPVNLFALLGVLVGLPLLMLVFTLLLLPGRLPGLASLQAVAAGMNVGRWVGAALDRFLGSELVAPDLLRGGGASAFSRWQLVVFSQWLAIGFFAGAITIALLLVTFTDLAFGWSTTLDMDSRTVYGWVSALAAPWAAWLPGAVPDMARVEASRFVRLEDGGMPSQRAVQLGDWWPFVLMTVLFYGALPRLLLLVFASWRLHRATRRLLVDDPEVTALLDRLDAPVVGMSGDGEENLQALEGPVPPEPGDVDPTGHAVALIWNQAAPDASVHAWLRTTLGLEGVVLAEVGILQREEDLRGTLAAAAQQLDNPVRRVIVVTKGWEPPLLEFMDFLAVVREVFGGGCSLTVVPLNLDGSGVDAGDRGVWAHALARLRDPRLYVVEARA
jgi:hypothetical protein